MLCGASLRMFSYNGRLLVLADIKNMQIGDGAASDALAQLVP